MKPKRVSFYEKYNDLHKRWRIDEERVLEIIKEFEWKLIEELASDEEWVLSSYFKDNRTIDEYIYDLLDGQIIEEFICEWFRARGCDAKRVGSDAKGMLIRNYKRKITTKPDLLVDGKHIELQISRKGKTDKYHIKKGKGNRILNNYNTLMMIVEDEYFIVDKELIKNCPIEPNYSWGGKLCYVLDNINIKYNKL